MTFGEMINESNQYYLSRGPAVIHKKPTPIQIVKVDYPRRSRAKIVEAYFRQASTTDYSGYTRDAISILKLRKHSKAIHADEKFSSTSDRSYGAVVQQGGICFVLLHFAKLSETYLLPAPALIHYYNIDHGSKSMPPSPIFRSTAF